MSFVNPYEPDPRSLSFTGSYVESWRFSFILLLVFVLYEVDVIFFISAQLFDILLLAGVGDFCCLMSKQMLSSIDERRRRRRRTTLSRTTTTTTTKGEPERERGRKYPLRERANASERV